MRPDNLRRDRQKQYSYMSQGEYEQQLRQQVEEKKKFQQQEKMQNQQEIINHYKNYQLGGADASSDLDQLVRNKEREIQDSGRLKQLMPQGGSNAFQGDMNELMKVHRTSINTAPTSNNNMRPDLLFSEDFLKNYRGTDNIMGGPVISQRNNENMNFINAANGNNYISQASQALADSERERRLKLRDIERIKRLEGISGGDYGNAQLNISLQPEIMSGASKRDQMWQQKMIQRVSSNQEYQRPPQVMPNIPVQLPIYQQQQRLSSDSHSSDGQVRSSRINAQINEAIKLDQSLNLLELQALQQKNNAQNLQQPPKASNPLFGNEDDLIKRRRDADRKQRQLDYQDYLVKDSNSRMTPAAVTPQNSRQPTIQQPHSHTYDSSYLPQQPPSAPQQQQPKQANDSQLLQAAGGMNMLGMHQLKREEDKMRMQKEYRQHLDNQTTKEVLGGRRKDLSDQVFAEMLVNKAEPQYQMKVEERPPKGDFFKYQVSEDDRKKTDYEKKRVYAIELQQQMATAQLQKSVSSESDRRRRNGSLQPHQQAQTEIQPPFNAKIFDYNQPQIAIQQQSNFSMQQYPPQQQPVYQNIAPIQIQQPAQDANSLHKQKQEDYRRDLEHQIKLKNDQKLFDKHIPPTTNDAKRPETQQQPQYNNQRQQPEPTSYVRQKTDLSNSTSTEEDIERKSRQQQYQEELMRQVDDRKRLKEEEKRKQLLEDQVIERKMQMQQQELKNKEKQELVKEGRVVKEERKRNVRRDQFEPSSENMAAQYGPIQQKSIAPRVQEESNWQQQMPEPVKQQEQNPYQYGDQGYRQQQDVQQTFNRVYQRAHPSSQPIAQSYYDQVHKSYEQHAYQPVQQQVMNAPSFGQAPYHQLPQDITSQPRQYEDDYGRMITMYQRAFQEIIDFKNQYMEEVMQMRERVIKEREEILEYEKVKQQQQLEIHNLKAVHDRLGDMLAPGSQQNMQQHNNGSINSMVQQNLNSLLMNQQQEIQRMSQSGGNGFRQGLQQRSQPETQNVSHLNVIQPNYYSKAHLQDSPNILEQSLSSETKFVIVPLNRVAAIAAQGSTQLMQTWKEDQLLMPPPPITNNNQQLPTSYQTLQQLQALTQTISQSLQGSSQFITGHTQTPQRFQSTNKQPLNIPETIQELPPNQEDDQSRIEERAHPVLKAARIISQQPITTTEEELDFNSRESSRSRGDEGFNIGNNDTLASLKRHAVAITYGLSPPEELMDSMIAPLDGDLLKSIISRITTAPKAFERNNHQETSKINLSRITDESLFLNKQPSQNVNLMITVTDPNDMMNKQKQQITNYRQQQEQQNENTSLRQKSELKTITRTSPSNSSHKKTHQKTQERFHQNAANTGSSFYNATMQHQKQQEQAQQEELQRQLMRIYGQIDEVQVRIQSEDHDMMMQTNINIADSMNEETQKQMEHIAMVNRLQSQQQQLRINPVTAGQVQIKPSSRAGYMRQNEEDPVEVKMNAAPRINQAPHQQLGDTSKFHGTDTQLDIWNDPDLVPPPVVNDLYDDQEDEGYFGGNHPQEQHAYGRPNHYMMIGAEGTYSNQNDETINQLIMFSPPSQEGDNDEQQNINIASYHYVNEFGGHNNQYEEIEERSSPVKRPPMSANNQNKQVPNMPFTLLQIPKHHEGARGHSAASGKDDCIEDHTDMLNEVPGALASDRSMSKKERDIIEIAKLIQKATDTTNSLFDNSENFKFRLKKAATAVQTGFAEPQKLHNAPSSLARKNNQKAVDPVAEEDKDNQIMSNLDRMIQNLQEQQDNKSMPKSFANQKNERIQIAIEDDVHQPSQQQMTFMRPTSGHQYGKAPEQQKSITSQRSLGRFAQMAVDNVKGLANDDKLIEEVSRKYGSSSRDKFHSPHHESNHQVVLRPVSGKSNSNRYGHIDALRAQSAAKQQEQNRTHSNDKSGGKQQQLYYDEESDSQE